jgi:uncharacterized protein YecE (DUF72 family)
MSNGWPIAARCSMPSSQRWPDSATSSVSCWCNCRRSWRSTSGWLVRDLRQRIDAPVACEPRHASWFAPEISDWLAERRVARVAADPAPVRGGGEPGGWNGLAYFRWHGSPRIYYSDYDEAALAKLSERLAASRQKGIPAWCILDNTALGAALGNALALTPQFKPVILAAG